MSENQEKRDGTYIIVVKDDGVYLTVLSPENGGNTVELANVFDELKLRKISDADRSGVEAAVLASDGLPHLIAGAQKPLEVATIQVTVSRDHMAAYLTVDLPENAMLPSVDDVKAKLASAEVTNGVIWDSILQAFRQPGTQVLCAEGIAPINGTDARIIQFADTSESGRPVEMEDGSVDFKNLNIYTMVEKGQVLAEKTPSTPGTPGKDVSGREIQAKPGKDVPLLPGKNMEVVDGNKLATTIAGQLIVVGGKINVSPVLEIKGDIDLSTGNIDFIGDVIIRGSVTDGFHVKAGGNVDVAGTVSGGCVEGVNVTVRMGIMGMNRGKVSASGVVAAKFIENATVAADEEILVSDVILHSHLSAGKKIKVSGKRGQIVGGVAIAGEEISAKSVGTSLATATELQAGVNPKIRDEYHALRKEIKVVEETLDQINKGLFKLKSIDPTLLPPDKKEMLLKLTRTQFTLLGQSENKRKRIIELEALLDDMRGGQIKIADYVYPGVKIIIGSLVKPIQETIRFVVYYADAGEVKFRPYK